MGSDSLDRFPRRHPTKDGADQRSLGATREPGKLALNELRGLALPGSPTLDCSSVNAKHL